MKSGCRLKSVINNFDEYDEGFEINLKLLKAPGSPDCLHPAIGNYNYSLEWNRKAKTHNIIFLMVMSLKKFRHFISITRSNC